MVWKNNHKDGDVDLENHRLLTRLPRGFWNKYIYIKMFQSYGSFDLFGSLGRGFRDKL